jgi:hypothetical protein
MLKNMNNGVNPLFAYFCVIIYTLYSIIMTIRNTKELKRIHVIKKRDNYKYDPTDIKYDSDKTIIKTLLICFMAGALGGIVGVAGGVILGPLFLYLGM